MILISILKTIKEAKHNVKCKQPIRLSIVTNDRSGKPNLNRELFKEQSNSGVA